MKITKRYIRLFSGIRHLKGFALTLFQVSVIKLEKKYFLLYFFSLNPIFKFKIPNILWINTHKIHALQDLQESIKHSYNFLKNRFYIYYKLHDFSKKVP